MVVFTRERSSIPSRDITSKIASTQLFVHQSQLISVCATGAQARRHGSTTDRRTPTPQHHQPKITNGWSQRTPEPPPELREAANQQYSTTRVSVCWSQRSRSCSSVARVTVLLCLFICRGMHQKDPTKPPSPRGREQRTGSAVIRKARVPILATHSTSTRWTQPQPAKHRHAFEGQRILYPQRVPTTVFVELSSAIAAVQDTDRCTYMYFSPSGRSA